ncbi:hypothetical protein [Aliiroseovarius subalbicans]|uniref:hypothetical protein n=1 Tax=Aliiroseovarius subalbicans TaxID=2925840 RepID=UPI001F579BFE|nr:hypothetical protein [Aliiroseovarius subalbicans]MCI2398934.1 hypothetical protein [Aliiroseovarius subalbicans]
MIRIATFRRTALAVQLMLSSFVAHQAHGAVNCGDTLSGAIPSRSAAADPGSDVMARLMSLGGAARDAAVTDEVLSGNVPAALRDLTPVTMGGTLAGGRTVDLVLCVTPDYLAVGSDADHVRVPLGLPAAARIADTLGFFLPTTRMVDAIYSQAELQLAPAPMKPTNQMTTTAYLLRHNDTVEGMVERVMPPLAALTAGQKKDVVLSNRLLSKRGKVAIYGWHRPNGRPIQPLSTVHGAYYADYSHGIRLVSQTAFVDGEAVALDEVLRDPELAQLVSSEGPVNAARLQASLH